MTQQSEIKFLGDFIDGKFLLTDHPDHEWKINSPSDLKDRVINIVAEKDNTNKACESAKNAFLSWARLPMAGRIEYLNKLKSVFVEMENEIAEVISRETGKPLWEGITEAKALVGKIDITINHSIKLVDESRIENALPGVDGVIRFKPRGVMAVIGPFNFPAHLPNGHIVPALLMGNTIVFKPSDKTPATGQVMAQAFERAGFPKGVFNLVQGQGEVGKRLAGHELVDGVLFTGSYEVGLKIKQETLNHHWKILALEMGGKNSTVVWEDADLNKSIYESILGAYLTSGQRCSCTSRIILHDKIYDKFLDHFYLNAKKIKIDHWKNNPFMGPLISQESVEKYIRFQEIAKREGAESLMRGKNLELDYQGYYVTPSIHLVKSFDEKAIYQKSEIFGPNVAIYKVSDFDEALKISNSSGYGLVMALFSKNKDLYEKALLEAKVGLLNWNRTTNGASSRLPFGGMGKSGNDRPSAHFAVNYCSIPVASLEDFTELESKSILPALQYEFLP